MKNESFFGDISNAAVKASQGKIFIFWVIAQHMYLFRFLVNFNPVMPGGNKNVTQT